MKQINPEYIAKFADFYTKKNLEEMVVEAVGLSEEQLNAAKATISAYEVAIADFDKKVKGFEGLKAKDKIDHKSGFVEEV